MDFKGKKFHFIAAGGVGMSALAVYLSQRGASVSGSDICKSKYTDNLLKYGISVNIGHDASVVKDDMVIVASSAIKDDNPEIVKAKASGLPVLHRSDVLKKISEEFSNDENKLFIGFSGTHGKTTTCGLCAYVLEKSNLNPSYVVGGLIPEINSNSGYGGGGYFCAELDESDGTIKKYSTDIAVINNMEEDHLDYYKNGFSDIARTFNEYLSNNPSQIVVINNDDPGCREFMKSYSNYDYVTFGFDNSEYTAKNIKYSGFSSEFDVYRSGKISDHIKLMIPGRHNVYNSLAVYAALSESGADMSEIVKHFSTFSGMGRRFQKVCSVSGIDIYDDYAHHPSEIKTVLAAAKASKNENSRLVVIFQPHRYSRLAGLWNEFKSSFSDADKLFVTDVYSAGEDEIENVNSKIFSSEINHSDVSYVPGNINDVAKSIAPELLEGDIVVTLGAGSVTKIGSLLKEELAGVCKIV